MTPKRKFVIEAETAVNIIKSHFHNDFDKLDKILKANGIAIPYTIDEYDVAILKLPNYRIENILLDIQY
jgi:hypothetical protein